MWILTRPARNSWFKDSAITAVNPRSKLVCIHVAIYSCSSCCSETSHGSVLAQAKPPTSPMFAS